RPNRCTASRRRSSSSCSPGCPVCPRARPSTSSSPPVRRTWDRRGPFRATPVPSFPRVIGGGGPAPFATPPKGSTMARTPAPGRSRRPVAGLLAVALPAALLVVAAPSAHAEPAETAITGTDVETTYGKHTVVTAEVPGARGRVALELGDEKKTGWV